MTSVRIDFWTAWVWWTGELREMAGAVRLWSRSASRRFLEIAVRDNGGDLLNVREKRGRSRERRLSRSCSSRSELFGALREPVHRGAAVVSLSISDCLVRTLTVPRAAIAHLGSILRLEVSRVTPFAASEVVSSWYVLPGQDRGEYAAIAHVIVRKDLIVPIIEKLDGLGRTITSVLIRDEAGDYLPIDLMPSLVPASHPNVNRWRRLCLGATAAAGALAIAAGLLILLRQATELALLGERLHIAQTRAMTVQNELAAIETSSRRVAGLKNEKINSPSPLAVWSEMSRLLPDTAWLAGISIAASSVNIDGTAQSAENLIAVLDQSPLFEKVAFTGPVIKTPGTEFDRFSISLNLSKASSDGGVAAP